jgi:glycosyltransferase involved in cell wall biosynthesis
VIIPAWNAAATLGRCLAALRAQRESITPPLEIIVVDDASTDETAAIALAAGVRLISLPVNGGRSVARNAGAAAAGGEILLFTDADCEPAAGWVEAMLAPFADPAVVGVKGAYLCCQREPVARFTQLELEEKYAVLAQERQISFIDTYSAGYRRDAFRAAGGFDPALTYSMLEDQDLSFRLAASGAQMRFAPQARVWHRHVTGAWPYYRRKFVIGRSKHAILQRHPERTFSDSRTPLTLRLQFALALLLTLLLLPALIVPPLRRLWWAALAALTASGIPFLGRVWRDDRPILPHALPLIWLRAFGLAHGWLAALLKLP